MISQMKESFEPPSVGMPNPYSGGGGGSPFSGIEGLLMNYAMEDAMGSAQQNAKQKVGGVMSGIQSLVSEAFPNFSGGMGSGTVGGGFNPPNQITQPTSPAPFVSESVTQPTGPSPSTPLLGDPTAPLLGGGGFNPDGGVPVTGLGGPQTLPLPMSEPAGPPPGVPPVDPSSVGLGGNPEIFQPPMTDPTTINPALTDPPMLPKMADFGPVSTNLTPKVPSFMDESGGAIDFSIFDNPAATNINDILAGQGGFPKVGADVKGPVTAEESYNPAMEYNLQAPLPQQDPLINLAYNYNMENSPF